MCAASLSQPVGSTHLAMGGRHVGTGDDDTASAIRKRLFRMSMRDGSSDGMASVGTYSIHVCAPRLRQATWKACTKRALSGAPEYPCRSAATADVLSTQ